MKKLVLPCLLLSVLAVNPIVAQVKKPVAKEKAPAAAVKTPVLAKVDPFTKKADDLVQLFNDEFKKLGLTLDNIEESTQYVYEVGGKKTTEIAYSVKTLLFTNQVTVDLTVDKNDMVTEAAFDIGTHNARQFKAIKAMFNFAMWPVIEQSETDTLHRSGNLLAQTLTTDLYEDDEISGHGLKITLVKTTPYTYIPAAPKPFDPKTLTINDNVQDVGYSIVDLMKKAGIPLLYKDQEIMHTNNGKLYSTSTTYYFNNAISADINTNGAKRFKSINIDAHNPITFLKLKKALGIAQWDKSDPNNEKSETFTFNGVEANAFSSTKYINFFVSPPKSDVIGRLQDTDVPTLDALMDLYFSGTKEQVLKTVAATYVNDYMLTDYPAPNTIKPNYDTWKNMFLIRTDNMTLPGKVYFNFGITPPDNIITLHVSGRDGEYLKRLYREFQTGKYKDKYDCEFNYKGATVDINSDVDMVMVIDKELFRKFKALKGIK